MSAFEQAVAQAIEKHATKFQIKQILTGIAKNVTDSTCTVERENAPTIHEVRLNAIDDDIQSYVTVFPKKGSNVIVGIIENLNTEAVVLKCSEIEKIKGKIGGHEFLYDNKGFKLSNTTDSIVKVLEDLISEVQKIIVVQGTTPNIPALEAIKVRMKQILQ